MPRLIAEGRNADGTELMAADVPAQLGGPFPLPPSDGSWQRDRPASASTARSGSSRSGRRTTTSSTFIRVEDIAYDKRAGMSNVVYVVDFGAAARPVRSATGLGQVRRTDASGRWCFDPDDPKVVTSMSMLIEGDDSPVKTIGEIHQPDNIESTVNGLYITEDPGSSQQFNFTPEQLADPNGPRRGCGSTGSRPVSASVVAKVDQSAR